MNKGKKILIWILLVGLLVIAALLVYSVKVERYSVVGSEHYTAEEVFQQVFPTENDRRFSVRMLRRLLGQEVKQTIPFIRDYELDFVSPWEVEITVYEKELIGYLKYMGTNLYIDVEGYVVEVSDEVLEELPCVTGIDFGYFVLNEKLPVKDETVFRDIITIAHEIQKNDLDVTLIEFNRKKEITLFMGDVQVLLGTGTELVGKISKLAEIYSLFEGRKGILYLNQYSSENRNKDIIFKNLEIEPE